MQLKNPQCSKAIRADKSWQWGHLHMNKIISSEMLNNIQKTQNLVCTNCLRNRQTYKLERLSVEDQKPSLTWTLGYMGN